MSAILILCDLLNIFFKMANSKHGMSLLQKWLFFAQCSFKTMFVGFPKGCSPFGVNEAGKMVRYLIGWRCILSIPNGVNDNYGMCITRGIVKPFAYYSQQIIKFHI